MNDIIIRKSEVDWLKIIDMAFNRQNWGKTYTLYTCQTCTISCCMDSFDFRKNKAMFYVKLEYTLNNRIEYEICFVDYYLKNFTIEDFKMYLNKRIISLLDTELTYRTKSFARGYFTDLKFDDEITSLMIEDSKYSADYSEISELSNEAFKRSLLAEVESKLHEEFNEDYNGAVDDYVENNCVQISGVNELLESLRDKEKKENE